MGKKMAGALKVSACYIVKNEAANLARSIKSLKSQVNEIVVVDTGSTDNTVAVAKKLGAKVYSFPWQDDFSKARNFALGKATGDWLVLLDADEYFTMETSRNLRQVIRQAHQQDGLLVQIVNYDADTKEIQNYFYHLRLVKNQQGLHYEGVVHEQLKLPDGKAMQLGSVPADTLQICHTGYSSSLSEEKARRNLKLLKQAVANGQSEEELARYFCDCYLGLEDMESCVHYAWLDVRRGRQPVSFASRCNTVLMEYYAKKTDEAGIKQRRELAEISVKEYPEVPDFWAEYSECLYQAEEYGQAISAMEKALELMQDYHGMEPSMLVKEHMEKALQHRLAVFLHSHPQYANAKTLAMLNSIMQCEQGKKGYTATLTNKIGISKDYAKKALDEHSICFISCVNDENEYAGCKQAISELEMPAGYQVEILGVRHAASMTAGYQQAMEASNAKYKIYLHQDVFVINPTLLQDLLDLFIAHPEIGMIGLAGSTRFDAEQPIWWNDLLTLYGTCYTRVEEGKIIRKYFGEVTNGTYVKVAAVDGLFMATQYDVPWRSDLFPGWHFYDVSQSREFINAGYQVIVPHQEEPWVIHDCGVKRLDESYYENMEIFKQNYTCGK